VKIACTFTPGQSQQKPETQGKAREGNARKQVMIRFFNAFDWLQR